MANPAKLTVRTIVGNNALAWPAADTIDTTGTVPVVAADMGGEADRVALLVTARGAVSARVAAGDLPPAVRQPLGDLSLPLASALAASVLINPAGANNDVLYTANVAGSQGNQLSVQYIDPGLPSQSLWVDVFERHAIRVHLATGAGGAITSTAAEVIAAVNAHWFAGHLVTAANGAGSSGAAAVTAVAETSLAGGADMDATHAALTTALAGDNNDIIWTAAVGGAAGNDITIAYVDPGAEDEALAVTVTENAIEVSLETSPEVAASVETELTGEDNDLVFTAVTPGAAGNSITITYTDPAGNDQSLDVTVVGTDIDVSLATDSGGDITSTAAEVLAAVNADGEAKLLVLASLPDGATGAGVVTAMSETALTGGDDGGAITSTAADIITEVASTPAAAALVSGANAAANDGTGVVTAMAATALTGGADLMALYGPFESARFVQDNGDLNINFEILNGEADVICFRLPRG